MREKKIFSIYGCFTVSRCINVRRKSHLWIFHTIEFLDTHVFINNPHWQSSGIIIFVCKYYTIISGTLVGSFLDVLLVLAGILSEVHEKPRRKDWVTEKNTSKNFWRGYHFLTACPLFSVFLLPPSQVTYLWNSPYKVE